MLDITGLYLKKDCKLLEICKIHSIAIVGINKESFLFYDFVHGFHICELTNLFIHLFW